MPEEKAVPAHPRLVVYMFFSYTKDTFVLHFVIEPGISKTTGL
jgi:hypothetical protein